MAKRRDIGDDDKLNDLQGDDCRPRPRRPASSCRLTGDHASLTLTERRSRSFAVDIDRCSCLSARCDPTHRCRSGGCRMRLALASEIDGSPIAEMPDPRVTGPRSRDRHIHGRPEPGRHLSVKTIRRIPGGIRSSGPL